MSNRRKQRAPLHGRRGWTISAAAIGVGGLAVWGVGTAEAATGGHFLLGKTNHETRMATLSNSKGTPLSLKAKSGSPPLKVNSSKLVPRLNASLLGGVSAAKLQRRVLGNCVWGISSISASGGVTCGAGDRLVFTSNGSVTIPRGVTEITGEIWGGGGGGGSGAGLPYSAAGGAGAEGGYERAVIPVAPGDVINVVVGAGGAGGVSNTNGVAGGTSVIKASDGSPVAGATGGVGGFSLACSGDAAGGDPMSLGVDVVGLAAHSGDVGHCNGAGGGRAGFAGAGGASGDATGYTQSGAGGEPGLVVISFDD